MKTVRSLAGVRRFFIYDPEKNVQICQVDNCQKRISGDHAANMMRHIETLHKDFCLAMNITRVSRKGPNASSAVSVQKIQNLKKINIKHSEELIWEGCVELVTQSGFPCSFISTPGFQKIISPITHEIEIVKEFNTTNLKSKITDSALNIRNKIRNDCQSIMLCLKVDSASYQDRAVFGVNLQYINDDSQLITNTLGIIDLKAEYTPEYLSSLIIGTLIDYNIALGQIYAITIDNDDNLIKTQKVVNRLEDTAVNVNESTSGWYMDCDDTKSTGDMVTFEDLGSESEYECMNVHNIFENMIEAGNVVLKSALQSSNVVISSIQCASNTIDVIIQEVLSQPEIQSKIDEFRKLVMILQDPQYIAKLQIENLSKPVLNNPARCLSTIDMIERLLDLRHFFMEQKSLFMELSDIDVDWSFMQEFHLTFQPIKTILLKLQCNQTFYSNFYKYWLELKFESKKISNNLSERLCTILESKEKTLLANPMLVSAIYLDPRFKFLLTPPQNEQARRHLKVLYDHTQNVTHAFNLDNVKAEQEEIISSPAHTSDLSDYLKFLESQQQQNPSISNQLKAYAEIENFKQNRLEPHTNVMEYWSMKKVEYPNLFALAKIVNSVPASQVSVERSFSALKYILNEKQNNLDEEFLQDILLVRLNT